MTAPLYTPLTDDQINEFGICSETFRKYTIDPKNRERLIQINYSLVSCGKTPFNVPTEDSNYWDLWPTYEANAQKIRSQQLQDFKERQTNGGSLLSTKKKQGKIIQFNSEYRDKLRKFSYFNSEEQQESLCGLQILNTYQAVTGSKPDFESGEIAFSGVFSNRKAESIITYSGYICLEIKTPNPSALKQEFERDELLNPQLMFVNLEEQQLNVVVSLQRAKKEAHASYFETVSTYIHSRYGVKVNESSSNPSHTTTLSIDPKAYLNPLHLQHAS